jgi:hypothetical protein
MRDWSIVRPEFWMGRTGRELRGHPAEVRELAFYLFSCPNHEMYGLYYKPIGTMALEIGRSEGKIRAGLVVLQGIDYCEYDAINEWVWVVEMGQIQMGLPLKPVDYKVSAANKWYQHLPRNVFLGPFFDRYCDSLHLGPPRRTWSPNNVSVTKQREEQGTVESPAQGLISISDQVQIPRSIGTERFDLFWAVYPKKVGKKLARIAWDKLKADDDLTAKIVAAVDRHRRSVRWLRDNGQAIPDPERYLQNERWNDENLDGPGLTKQTIQNVQGTDRGTFFAGFRD